MMGGNSGVQATCKVCSKQAAATSFKYHYDFGQMVCPGCYSGKIKRAAEKEKAQVVEKARKPAGWDSEDDYLAKAASVRKDQLPVNIQEIPGSQMLRVTCKKCTYSFKYHPVKRRPSNCPYCALPTPGVRVFQSI